MLPDSQTKMILADTFIGRQPIYGRTLQVIGYELLYRHNNVEQAEFISADFATSQVVMNAFAEMGLEKIVGNKKAFINLTRNFFLEKYPIPFVPEQLVLEVTEETEVDIELITAITGFKERGFKIALDDVRLEAGIIPLLKIADIVKLDFQTLGKEKIREAVEVLRKYSFSLLAEKVETPEDYQLAKGFGFNYFQGYFLCRPEVVQGRKVPSSRLVILELMHTLQKPYIDFRALEAILPRM